MLGSPILDVAIGMAFIYLLLSLIASTVQEVLASLVQARSANLERGLRSLFSGDKGRSGVAFVERLYDHGLVRGLYQDPDRDFRNHPDSAGIKASRFALFSGFRLRARRLLRINPPGVPDSVNNLYLPSYIPSRTFALAMRDMLNDPQPFGWDSMKNIAQNLETLRQEQPDNRAAQALLALVQDAAGDPDRLQRDLENWYSDSMDRVSGWYKKYVQNLLLIIGLILAVVFNVDSLRLGRALWMDKDARTGLVTAATDYMARHPDPPAKAATMTANPPQATTADVPGASTPTLPGAGVTPAEPSATMSDQNTAPEAAQPGAGQAAQGKAATSSGSSRLDIGDLTATLKGTVQAFDEVTRTALIPVGWRHQPGEYKDSFMANPWQGLLRLLLGLIGWLITATALSLGASFWFDTLNKFMVVRGTIKPQEKSQTEGSKD